MAAGAGLHIHKVVKKTVDLRGLFGQKTKRSLYAGLNLFGRAIISLMAEAQGRQSETGCSRAGQCALISAVSIGAVAYQSSVRVCLIPEILKRCTLHFVQSCCIIAAGWIGWKKYV